MGLVGFLSYIDYKRKQKEPDRKPDPLLKSAIFTAFILMLVVVLELTGSIPEGTIKRIWFIFPLMGCCIFGLYFWVLRKKIPMTLEQQLLAADNDVHMIFAAEVYRDETNFLPLDDYKTTQEPGRPDVGNLVITRKMGAIGKMVFWIQRDKVNRELLRLTPHPTHIQKKQLEDKAFPTRSDVLENEFAGEEQKDEKENEEKS